MTEAIGWTGVIIAVVSMIRGEVSAYTARKAARDKMEFDAELVRLTNQNSLQAAQIAANARQIVEVKEDTAKCKEEHKETKAELKECHEKHETTDARMAFLEAVVGRLAPPGAFPKY